MSGLKSEAGDKSARDEFMFLLVLVESGASPVNRLWSARKLWTYDTYLSQRPVWRRSVCTQSHIDEDGAVDKPPRHLDPYNTIFRNQFDHEVPVIG